MMYNEIVKNKIENVKTGGICMNFYLVTAKCGHVGKSKYMPIVFPVQAESGKEAARIVRNFGRVKHDHKDAILNVEKTSEEVYLNQIEINHNDPYLQFSSKHEQRMYKDLIESRVLDDPHNNKIIYKRKRESVFYRIQKYELQSRYARVFS